MKTFYIDVYFLLNFTVDILALYFAASLIKIKSTVLRLVLSGGFGAMMSCIIVLFAPTGLLFASILIIGMIITVEIFCPIETKARKFKALFAFLIFETLIGGLIGFSYSLLDTYFYPIVSEQSFGAENRRLLLVALLVLLTYGILKLVFLVFYSSKSEKNVNIIICLNGEFEKISALVDSGCFLCDPLDGKPVIIVKKRLIGLTNHINNVSTSKNEEIKKRVRIIPVKTLGEERILMGLRTDYIEIEGRKQRYENIVIALDNGEGSFGGYAAIAPLSLIE